MDKKKPGRPRKPLPKPEVPEGRLHCYASGSGALSYTYVRQARPGDRGSSPGDMISTGSPKSIKEIPPELVPADFLLCVLNSQVLAVPRVERVGPTELRYKDGVYTYYTIVKYETWERRGFRYKGFHDMPTEVLNENTRAALRFFLEHEGAVTELVQQYRDYQI